jgi:hypothetical protein
MYLSDTKLYNLEVTMAFTRAQLRLIATAMDVALSNIDPSVGAEFTVGNISYSGGKATIKVTALEVNKNGDTFDPLAEAFKANAFLYGASPDDLGKTFTTYNGTYTLVGLKPNNTKYPVIGERDGKRYKFEPSVLQRLN